MSKKIKEKLGEFAAKKIHSGMTVGLGSGSTAEAFIKALAKRCQEGLKIQAIASSSASENLARNLAIPLVAAKDIESINLTVDGADEIDPNGQLIKGGGGALLREKIIAKASNELLIIADESKWVKKLGAFGLALELSPFAVDLTIKEIEKAGFQGRLRKKNDKVIYSDNQGLIFDLKYEDQQSLYEDQQKLLNIPGVVETGLFLNFSAKFLKGLSNGEIIDL